MNINAPILNRHHYEKIETVLEFFDFEKVHEVMSFLEWTWQGYGTVASPSVEQLKEKARQLLESVGPCESGTILDIVDGDPNCKITFCSSGGFTARFNGEDFSLSFEIARSTSDLT